LRIQWHVTQEDKEVVRSLIESQRHTVLVRDRRDRNLAENKKQVTKERLWRAIVCMRLTTLAHSGPSGKWAKFQRLRPFPLAYDECLDAKTSLENFILKVLQKHQVGTHQPTISSQLASNLYRLEQGDWNALLANCNQLITGLVPRTIETEVADFVEDTLEGFGPKQSRNVLQALGLTRFEIPIDSRVTAWLNEKLKLPFQVTSQALGDRACYGLVSDAIYELCKSCGSDVFPCILDASIFGEKDGDHWKKEQLEY
jgi:hypothetical protein